MRGYEIHNVLQKTGGTTNKQKNALWSNKTKIELSTILTVKHGGGGIALPATLDLLENYTDATYHCNITCYHS